MTLQVAFDAYLNKFQFFFNQNAEPVLIHGTRGEDATLLVCSLVQIILNPDCRTIRG